MVTTLLYADDAVMLAENEEQVKRCWRSGVRSGG